MNELCEQCNKYPKFQYNDKIYKLCAGCGWAAFLALLGYEDDPQKTPQEKMREVLQFVPFSEWQ